MESPSGTKTGIPSRRLRLSQLGHFPQTPMNYASLGDRLKSSAAENFPIFLADLCTRADQAYLTPSTRPLLERREQSEFMSPSSRAILDYATHRLLWSWYRRDSEAQGREPDPGRRGPGPEAHRDFGRPFATRHRVAFTHRPDSIARSPGRPARAALPRSGRQVARGLLHLQSVRSRWGASFSQARATRAQHPTEPHSSLG